MSGWDQKIIYALSVFKEGHMSRIIKDIEIVKNFFSLMNSKRTGTPKKCAEQLAISQRTLYRVVEEFSDIGIPIKYDRKKKSYIYDEDIMVNLKFEIQDLSTGKKRAIL
jgi:predicted DNA-binding transcriptional regulator YafY